MRNLLDAQLIELGIKEALEIEFIYTPPYSPNLNLVEYLIHQLRLQLLHHQPVGMTIELVREKLELKKQRSHSGSLFMIRSQYHYCLYHLKCPC